MKVVLLVFIDALLVPLKQTADSTPHHVGNVQEANGGEETRDRDENERNINVVFLRMSTLVMLAERDNHGDEYHSVENDVRDEKEVPEACGLYGLSRVHNIHPVQNNKRNQCEIEALGKVEEVYLKPFLVFKFQIGEELRNQGSKVLDWSLLQHLHFVPPRHKSCAQWQTQRAGNGMLSSV
jgi:hypothetical protein